MVATTLELARWYARRKGFEDLLDRAEVAVERDDGEGVGRLSARLALWGSRGDLDAADLASILDGDLLPLGVVSEKLQELYDEDGIGADGLAALARLAEALGLQEDGDR